MQIKQSMLAASITAALAMGVVGEAAATIYAGSRLDIDNLNINITPGDPQATRFDFRLTNTADLDTSVIQTATCSNSGGCGAAGLPLVLDALPANAPVGDVVRMNNLMNFFGPGGNYANSDSVVTDAQLRGDPTTKTTNVAEASLESKPAAGADAEIQSNTGFNFTFTLAAPGTLTLTFDANPDMRALVSALDTGLALANLNTSFSLRQDTGGTGLVNWNPQGTFGVPDTDCIASGGPACVETADTEDLNINVTSSTAGADNVHSFAGTDMGLQAYGITVTGLTAGTWSLGLNEQKSVNLTNNQVPEPGILALVGIGLMGLGMSSLRKKRV